MKLPIVECSAEQQELWNRVAELWALSKSRESGPRCIQAASDGK